MTATVRKGIAAAALATALVAAGASAGGDPTRRAERLEELRLDGAAGFSVTEYQLESGVYYRWRIVSDGREEYRLLAPGLFRNAWIDQVSIEGREVKPMGLYAVEFDSEGAIDIWFVPVRPGDYRFYVESLEDQGFTGVMRVR